MTELTKRSESQLAETKEKLKEYDYVRFSMCDLNGTYRGQVVSGRHAASYLETGVDLFEGVLVAGPQNELVFVKHEYMTNMGSMEILPDLETLRLSPWSDEGEVKVGEILCESYWKNGIPQAACPRFVARKQFKRLEDLGLKLYSGYEVEFLLYHKDSMKPIFEGTQAYGQRKFNRHAGVIYEFDRKLAKAGIEVERYHCELDQGMYEAIMSPKFGIQSQDMLLNMKEGLMEMADQKEMIASFMSKPKNGKNYTGIAGQFNLSLWDQHGKNLFYDEDAPDKLSDIAKYWIAGILKHSKAICAFASPTVNCYRRLHNDFFPTDIFWGIQDRCSILRVKNDGPKATYFECRVPSGKSNAYLVTAATIAAGLDGVEKKLECPQPGKSAEAEKLPLTLSDALEELQKDSELVAALGQELVDWFVICKKDGEIAKYNGLESDDEKFALEKEKYFD